MPKQKPGQHKHYDGILHSTHNTTPDVAKDAPKHAGLTTLPLHPTHTRINHMHTHDQTDNTTHSDDFINADTTSTDVDTNIMLQMAQKKDLWLAMEEGFATRP